jgi:hypothetical protein
MKRQFLTWKSKVRIPVIEALLQQVPLSTHGVKVLAFDIEVTEVMEISGASAEEFLTRGFFRNRRHKTT